MNQSHHRLVAVERTPSRRFPAEPLALADVEALRAACSRRAPTGIRNRALLAVLFRSGLRVSEALALFPKDLDPTGCSLRVLHGKGNKARTAPLRRHTQSAVGRLAWAPQAGQPPSRPAAPLSCPATPRRVVLKSRVRARRDAYGPGVHMDAAGRPYHDAIQGGGQVLELTPAQPNAYAPGVGMDAFGRRVVPSYDGGQGR
jgi:integrase